MKIAIVHDVVEEWGGANKFLLEILKIYPKSDLYTLFFEDGDLNNFEIRKRAGRVVASNLVKFWKKFKMPYFRTFLLLISPWFWEKLDLSEYDLVISSTYGYGSFGVIVSPWTKHLCYCHTPSKRMYGERSLMTVRGGKYKSHNFSFLYKNRRLWDFVAAHRPDIWWSNSKYTQMRVKRVFGVESKVVYVPLKSYKHSKNKSDGEYYLYFGRLVLDKGIELIINSFNENRKKLLIVGRGEDSDEKYLKSLAKENIEFYGFAGEGELPKIFSKTRALIFAAKGEDFGMVMVEAMSAGVPVIAFKAGGASEIVENGKSGVLFNEYSQDGLNEAIERFEEMRINPNKCIERADFFIKNGFSTKIKGLVGDLINKRQ
ncbi:glycosyltransferase [Patescibacteria group bacterium]|nr:glycosyltransferase [Patescibacteria group bacterium]